MIVVPVAPVSLTAEVVASVFNLKAEGEAQRVLDLATVTVNRALAGAFRTVDQTIYDDLVRRVVGAIVASTKRPTVVSGQGQLTTVAQTEPGAPRGDYLAPIRADLAQYVVPL